MLNFDEYYLIMRIQSAYLYLFLFCVSFVTLLYVRFLQLNNYTKFIACFYTVHFFTIYLASFRG